MKISKEIKDKGKVAFDGPKVNGRKKFAPKTKVETPKKGKGSKKKKETFVDDLHESSIINLIEALVEKNYNSAFKYLSECAEEKIACLMKAELKNPIL